MKIQICHRYVPHLAVISWHTSKPLITDLRWQLFDKRQMPPLAPCFHEVQHRVCQFPLAPLVRSHPGIEWFYHCPLCICQVARVRLPHFIASFHVFILLLESAFVNTGSKSNTIIKQRVGMCNSRHSNRYQ